MLVEGKAWTANKRRKTGHLTFLLRRPKTPKLGTKIMGANL